MKVQIKELIIESEKDFSTVLIQIGENGEVQETKPVFEKPSGASASSPFGTDLIQKVPEGSGEPIAEAPIPPSVTKTREPKELPPEMMDVEF